MARGFSLLEVLLATTVLVVGVAGLAPSFPIASRANRLARDATVATLLAAQKMEQLRAAAWSVDPTGAPLSDTTTDLTSALAAGAGGVGLSASPAGSLTQNVLGYCDFLDASGVVVGDADAAPAGAIYARRWSIDPLPSNPSDTLVLQVLVTRFDATAPRPEDVRLVSVRTRKAL
jgi:prepilin-type N-terminal cleavage/methylation domain-containing protein